MNFGLIPDRHRYCTYLYYYHLHSCTQHAGATTGAHEHILTAVQQLFTQAGYAADRKNVPHSRGKKKADLHVKDFRLEGSVTSIIDVTLRGEFHGSCSDPARNGEAPYVDDDRPFIVLTETKFSSRCIPVWIGTLLTGLGSKTKNTCDNVLTMTSKVPW